MRCIEYRLYLGISAILFPSYLLYERMFTHIRYLSIHKNEETLLPLFLFAHPLLYSFLNQCLDLCKLEVFKSEESMFLQMYRLFARGGSLDFVCF
jgi:hypothetical protein